MKKEIPYARQHISEEDIQSVVDILRSDMLTQGPSISLFEESVMEYCGVAHAVASSSATAALHIACMALELGQGDLLWTSPNTFVSSANCALYCGASVDFVDIDSQTYNMSLGALTKKLEEAEKNGQLPKVVIPVHFAGQSCEMREIKTLSEKYGFKIIEDASHAIGGKYLDEFIGGCSYSDITVFSFHPVKIVTSGEGGIATTKDEKLARKMQLFRSHYITRESDEIIHTDKGRLYYEQFGLGYNYRMTDIHAALGLSQMKRLGSFITRRHEIAKKYNESLKGLALILPWQHSDSFSAYHLYVVRFRSELKNRKEIIERLWAEGILVNIHYIPVHTQPYYQELGFKSGDFPKSESYYKSALSIPMFPALTESEQDRVIDVLKKEFYS